MNQIVILAASFLKTGFINFGGGYAMISLLQSEVLAHSWLTVSEFTDVVAISQITPGPIAVNLATYVGFTQAGLFGSFAATMAVSLPSFLIVTLLMRFLHKFNNSEYVKSVFNVLRPVVVGMIFAAAFLIGRTEFLSVDTGIEFKSILVALAAFTAMFKFKISPAWCIVGAAAVGIFIF